MSSSPQPESEQAKFKSWDSESWTRRPISNAEAAAFHAGRLLNVFGFHAQQAWLLDFRCLDERSAVQQEAAAGALQALKVILPTLQPRDLSAATDLLTARLRDLRELDGDFDYWWGLNNDVERGELSREECSRQLGLYGLSAGVMFQIASQLPTSRSTLLRLGECLDAGLRPRDIYAYLWDQNLRPEMRKGEELFIKPNGATSIFFHDPKTGGGGIRGINSLANRSRNAGEAPPEAGWQSELLALLRQVDGDQALAEMLPAPLSDFTFANLPRVVDELDQRIRAWLAPRTPFWDDAAKVLRIGSTVIKNLHKQRAGPQVDLFRAFQDAGWPTSVKNPFVDPIQGKPVASLLHQTVRSSNKNQKNKLIRFSVSDSGHSVSWDLAEVPEPTPK